jgi:3-oxoacyl-[acyl-carrier protein] reductase
MMIGVQNIDRPGSLAWALGPRNIRVSSVAPGYVESEMVKDLTDQQKQRIVRRPPLGWLTSAEGLANAPYFSIPEWAAFTGRVLVMGGGITC